MLKDILFKGKVLNILIISAILFAAFLHAFWNFLVRGGDDKILAMAAIVFGHAPLAFLGLLIVGFPEKEALPYIIASSVLHVGYQSFLMNAYRFGGLTQIYPIARGAAPLIIAVLSIIMLIDKLSILQLIGVGIISAGILVHGISQFNENEFNLKGFLLALATAGFIAAYSMVDGTGTRITQNSISYYGGLTIGNCLLFSIYLALFHRGVLSRVITEARFTFLVGGSASYLAYVLVLWACLYLPIAVVSSIRETSVLFALLLGTLFLKEKITLQRLIVVFIIVLGIIILRLT